MFNLPILWKGVSEPLLDKYILEQARKYKVLRPTLKDSRHLICSDTLN